MISRNISTASDPQGEISLCKQYLGQGGCEEVKSVFPFQYLMLEGVQTGQQGYMSWCSTGIGRRAIPDNGSLPG